MLCIVYNILSPLFAVKVSPFGGSTLGHRGAVACSLAEEEMHTTTRLWCKPIVVRVQNTTRSGCKPLLVCSSNYYWSAR